MKALAKGILKLFGWSVSITVPDIPKCIVCVAPHTSNWDFILGKLAYATTGRKASFLMKDSWFVWPLGYFFRAIGGIAVPRGKRRRTSLTDVVVEKFRTAQRLTLAITPEGTRSLTRQWHTGFLHIAMRADVPIALGVIDFADKKVMINTFFTPTGDIDADMAAIKQFYRPFKGKYPEKFSAE